VLSCGDRLLVYNITLWGVLASSVTQAVPLAVCCLNNNNDVDKQFQTVGEAFRYVAPTVGIPSHSISDNHLLLVSLNRIYKRTFSPSPVSHVLHLATPAPQTRSSKLALYKSCNNDNNNKEEEEQKKVKYTDTWLIYVELVYGYSTLASLYRVYYGASAYLNLNRASNVFVCTIIIVLIRFDLYCLL